MFEKLYFFNWTVMATEVLVILYGTFLVRVCLNCSIEWGSITSFRACCDLARQ